MSEKSVYSFLLSKNSAEQIKCTNKWLWVNRLEKLLENIKSVNEEGKISIQQLVIHTAQKSNLEQFSKQIDMYFYEGSEPKVCVLKNEKSIRNLKLCRKKTNQYMASIRENLNKRNIIPIDIIEKIALLVGTLLTIAKKADARECEDIYSEIKLIHETLAYAGVFCPGCEDNHYKSCFFRAIYVRDVDDPMLDETVAEYVRFPYAFYDNKTVIFGDAVVNKYEG